MESSDRFTVASFIRRIATILLMIILFSVPFDRLCFCAEVVDAYVKVYFSPRGGCTEAIIEALNHASSEILVQAYSFTSAPIAQAKE